MPSPRFGRYGTAACCRARTPIAAFTLADAQRVLAHGFESWTNPMQKVEGVAEFCAAAARGDVATLKALHARDPQLVRMEVAGTDERTALHHAVLNRRPEAVRFLMAAGADARKGVYPNRAATTPLVIATDRGYDEIASATPLAWAQRYGRHAIAQRLRAAM